MGGGGSGSKKFGPFPPAGMILVQFKFNRKVHQAGEHPGNQAGCIKGVCERISCMTSWCFIIGGRQGNFCSVLGVFG